ncbi:MAG: ATP-binding protein [Flavobacteriaceae bacterium]|nr:ATP-binding protein [Flavobacteriaceae bacterium]
MNPKKIVITGAPGTGKSSVIDQLEEWGYFCFHEIIRTMTLEAKKSGKNSKQITNPLAFVDDPYQFNLQLLKGRLTHYQEGSALDHELVFFDRGIPDVLAYMDYFGQEYDKHFLQTASNHRYDTVFLLPPWKEIYVTDNERLETFDEAVALHHALQDRYQALGYDTRIVPEGTVEERTELILETLKSEI